MTEVQQQEELAVELPTRPAAGGRRTALNGSHLELTLGSKPNIKSGRLNISPNACLIRKEARQWQLALQELG
ncbi:GL14709 [Drosophila persimilis]|uniref:GL14709 n=1 Tax=Drosophila persimilis TaxID=7234 RepID=B4GVS0_DROPE|nr:GL14709 [Drosophila persimilis]